MQPKNFKSVCRCSALFLSGQQGVGQGLFLAEIREQGWQPFIDESFSKLNLLTDAFFLGFVDQTCFEAWIDCMDPFFLVGLLTVLLRVIS